MPSVPPLPDLVLYARPGCSLCDEAREAIDLVVADRRARGSAVPNLIERNIEDDPELHRRFLERIPVVEIGGQRVELVVSVGKVRRLLNEVLGEVTSPAQHPETSESALAPDPGG
jgi:Glutaredoxin-like domain (DUF836)